MQKIIIYISFITSCIGFIFGQENVTITDNNGNSEYQISCKSLPSNGIDLSVKYPSVNGTESYIVESINYNPVGSFDAGTPLKKQISNDGIKVDDFYSPLINIGFDFCFLNNTYKKLTIGSNGVISFNPENANSPMPSGINDYNPSPLLPQNSIFAPLSDFYIPLDSKSEIYTSTIGKAPYRKFVINYYEVEIFRCPTRATFQVVLHETTNKIEIFIKDKPKSCIDTRSANSLIGILNEDGSYGLSPQGRNTGKWAAKNEGWVFLPSSETTPEIAWYDDEGNLLSIKENITVFPTQNTKYTVEVNLMGCSNSSQYFKDTYTITEDRFFPGAKKTTFLICSNDTSTINLNTYASQIASNPISNFNYQFYSTQQAAENKDNSKEITNFTIQKSKIVYFRLENKNDNSCYKIHPVTFSLGSGELDKLDFKICDNNNDNIEVDFNIQSYLEKELADLDYSNLLIFDHDPTSNSKPIQKATITPKNKYWIQINLNNNCGSVFGPYSFKFYPAPNQITLNEFIYETCDVYSNKVEDIDWEKEIKLQNPNLSKNFKLLVFGNESLANNLSAKPLKIIKESTNKVYVRVINDNNCFTVIPMDVNVNFTGAFVKEHEDFICFDGSENLTISLKDYVNDMVDDRGENYSYQFYSSFSNARDQINPIDSQQELTGDGNYVGKIFYLRVQTSPECFSIKKLTIFLVNPEPETSEIAVCDTNGDGVEKADIKSFTYNINGTIQRIVKFYKSFEDAKQNKEEITGTYKFIDNQTLYAKITQNGCTSIDPVRFYLTPSIDFEEEINIKIESCNELNNRVNLLSYNQKIYDGNIPHEINYFKRYSEKEKIVKILINNPASYRVNSGDIVYALIDFYGKSCNKIIKLNFDIQQGKTFTLNEATLFSCDADNDFNEVFNLRDSYNQIFSDIQNYDIADYTITFHADEIDAVDSKNKLPYNYIPNSYESEVFVRVLDKKLSCLYIGKIYLKYRPFPKIYPATYNLACDLDGNGFTDIFVENLVELVNPTNLDGEFTFYLSESAANNELKTEQITDEFYSAPSLPTSIWVRAENEAACYSVVEIKINEGKSRNIAYKKNYELNKCDSDGNGFEEFNLETITNRIGVLENFSFHLSMNDLKKNIPIKNYKNFTNKTPYQDKVFLKVSYDGFCPDVIEIDLKTDNAPEVKFDFPEYFCMGEEITINPELKLDINNFTYEWQNEAGEIISKDKLLKGYFPEGRYYFIITPIDDQSCPAKYPVNINILDKPNISFENTEFCKENIKPVVANFNFDPYQFEYRWELNDEILSTDIKDLPINVEGNYKLILESKDINNTCEFEYFVEVKEIKPPTIINVETSKNQVKINALGNRVLAFSIDGDKWQNSNIFYNLPIGKHFVYVKYQDIDCVSESKEITVNVINNIITPNGDGVNDEIVFFSLPNNSFENIRMQIFTRSGKLIYTAESSKDLEWDGKLNGRPLPTGDYWYIIDYPDGKKYSGHITIKNK